MQRWSRLLNLYHRGHSAMENAETALQLQMFQLLLMYSAPMLSLFPSFCWRSLTGKTFLRFWRCATSTGKEKGKRHPTIGNRVVIASGAKVLGSFKVGDHSNIGANSVVLREVPPNCTVVGIPGRLVKCEGRRVGDRLDPAHLPDLLMDRFRFMQEEINELNAEMNRLKAEPAKPKQAEPAAVS